MLIKLEQKLVSLEGENYGSYKQIKGCYNFEKFDLLIDYIQGDPFAEPSRVRARIKLTATKIPAYYYENKIREIALRDFLTRHFHLQAKPLSQSCGSGKSGLISIDLPQQQILDKTSVLIQGDFLDLRFVCGLPANGRRILGHAASKMLTQYVKQAVLSSMFFSAIDEDALKKHVHTAEDAEALRSELIKKELVGFIANGSKLARRSGIDDRPFQGDSIAFQSMTSLEVGLNTPHSGIVKGLGIKQGVTVIVGGGYHGKSTILKALETGVYNHIPGDGREQVVCEPTAMKIRAEDGRSVSGVSITPFISNLPLERDTDNFSTTNASGSTSQAASIIEAIEAGSRTLLIDEDTSATNFMIRDRRMQALIAKEREPITPFSDKVRQIKDSLGISTVLVMGGSGDYFKLADCVIAMDCYQPNDVTDRAHQIAQQFDTGRVDEGGESFGSLRKRSILQGCINSRQGKRQEFFRVRRTEEIEVGEERINCQAVAGLVHESQLRSAARAIIALSKTKNNQSFVGALESVERQLELQGLESLSTEAFGNLAYFRKVDLAAILNRMRNLKT